MRCLRQEEEKKGKKHNRAFPPRPSLWIAIQSAFFSIPRVRGIAERENPHIPRRYFQTNQTENPSPILYIQTFLDRKSEADQKDHPSLPLVESPRSPLL